MNQSITPELTEVMPQAMSSYLFVSLFTLQILTTTQGPTGNPIGAWVNVGGVVGIPCIDAPPSVARIQATEMKDVAEILAKGMRHVLLDQCFLAAPSWAGMTARANVDGIIYQVMGAENDSQLRMTRVDLQLAAI